MIYMTHYADNGRSLNQRILRILGIPQKLLDNVDLLLRLADNIILYSDIFCLLIGKVRVYRIYLALHEKLFNKSCGRNLHLRCQLSKSDGLRQNNGLYNLFYLGILLLLLLLHLI